MTAEQGTQVPREKMLLERMNGYMLKSGFLKLEPTLGLPGHANMLIAAPPTLELQIRV